MSLEMPAGGGPESAQRGGRDLSMPSAPPAQLYAEMAVAAQRVGELREEDREVRFGIDDRRRVVIEVRNLDGKVISSIRPREMLDIVAGAPLDTDRGAASD